MHNKTYVNSNYNKKYDSRRIKKNQMVRKWENNKVQKQYYDYHN